MATRTTSLACCWAATPWATIAHSKVFMPMRKEVSGYVMDPLGIHRFDGVDIAE